MVVAGDTLLKPDFRLDSFVSRYEELNPTLVDPDSGWRNENLIAHKAYLRN